MNARANAVGKPVASTAWKLGSTLSNGIFRSPQYDTENEVLSELARRMVESPDTILACLCEASMRLIGPGSAGISVLEAMLPVRPADKDHMPNDNEHTHWEHEMQRTRTVETARLKARSADGRPFDIVEMTDQEILPSTDGRLDTWRSVSSSYRTSRGTPVKLEPDGTMTIMSRPTVSVTRELGQAADF